MHRPAQHRDGPAGFTLLELLIVVGLLSLLLGLGVGFLRQGSSGRGAALSAIAGQLRAAALAARSRGLPTEVRIEPATDAGPATVRGRALLPVVTFHLEPQEHILAPVLQPTVTGVDEPQGRFGHARRNRAGEKAPLLRLSASSVDFDLSDGFAFRLDLHLEQRTAATVLKLGGGLELQLDNDGRPKARLVQRGPGGHGGMVLTIIEPEPMPLHRWCTLEVAHDGSDFWLCVDDRQPVVVRCKEPLQQTREDVLELSPGDQPVPGAVDELQWLVYALGEAQLLPAEAEPERAYRIAFAADGEPVAPPAIVLLLRHEQRSETFTVKRSGVIE